MNVRKLFGYNKKQDVASACLAKRVVEFCKEDKEARKNAFS